MASLNSPRKFCDDTFPTRLLEHVKLNAKERDMKSVLATIDNYCWTVESGMNVGDKKGAILDTIIKERAPKIVLEFGTYCGYSAIRMASCLETGTKLYTLENNSYHAQIAREMIKFAGADEIVTVLEGSSSEILPDLKKTYNVQSFDFVFIDHWKNLYLPDFKTLESLKLIQSGSVCVADNCIYPGCPDFLEYVRNSQKYDTTNYKSYLEYHETEDSIEKVVVK